MTLNSNPVTQKAMVHLPELSKISPTQPIPIYTYFLPHFSHSISFPKYIVLFYILSPRLET